MSRALKTLAGAAWRELLAPMLRRPPALQIAALCRRAGPDGRAEVLLVTSRGTGRWLLPKGWPAKDRDAPATALMEAWEEAGLTGARVERRPLGEYEGVKRHDSGLEEPARVLVYALDGGHLVEDYPEAGQRRRRWAPPAEAAELVDEPGLSAFLGSL